MTNRNIVLVRRVIGGMESSKEAPGGKGTSQDK